MRGENVTARTARTVNNTFRTALGTSSLCAGRLNGTLSAVRCVCVYVLEGEREEEASLTSVHGLRLLDLQSEAHDGLFGQLQLVPEVLDLPFHLVLGSGDGTLGLQPFLLD